MVCCHGSFVLVGVLVRSVGCALLFPRQIPPSRTNHGEIWEVGMGQFQSLAVALMPGPLAGIVHQSLVVLAFHPGPARHSFRQPYSYGDACPHSYHIYFLFRLLPALVTHSLGPFFPRIRTFSLIMGVGAVLEPLVVIVLLFGGTWINRATKTRSYTTYIPRSSFEYSRAGSPDSLGSGYSSPISKDGLLGARSCSPLSQTSDERCHQRRLTYLGFSWTVSSPNTVVFRDRLMSRLLGKLPFLVECWYWALMYWVSRYRCKK